MFTIVHQQFAFFFSFSLLENQLNIIHLLNFAEISYYEIGLRSSSKKIRQSLQQKNIHKRC